jgi:GT2 family glycosyltransferase
MKVSVIVLVWNGLQYLPACLDALLDQEYADCEIVVVDNASTDGSADFVTQRYPQVRLIRNQRNLGFAAGNNVGLGAATGDVLVLLNQDTIVRPGWLRGLVQALERPEVGVVGCKILYPDAETIQHAGGWIEWPLGSAHHYGQRERDTGQWDVPRAVEYVTGAAMAFRRDVLEKAGFLDEAFWPGYFEDTDFCLRARQAGYEVWYAPQATLIHLESASHTNQLSMWEAHHRGRLRFVLKHVSPDQFLAQFAQAETLYQPDIVSVFGSRPLCRVYLETISRTPSILRQYWRADQATIDEVVRTFQRLHSLAWEGGWQRVDGMVKAEIVVPALPTYFDTEATVNPQLQEIEFQSDRPVVGSLIARLRSFWYGIAAQWGIRYLMQQQDLINHQARACAQRQEIINARYQRYIETLEQRLTELADENALLAKEIANLGSRLEDD